MTLPKITSKHIKEYLENYLKDASASTRERKIFSLKKFFEWAQSEGLVAQNPISPYLEELNLITARKKGIAQIQQEALKQSKFTKRPLYANLQKKVLRKFHKLPKLQNILYKVFYTRPNWYKRYHSYALSQYFHLAILVIFSSALGWGLYDHLFAKNNPSVLGYPATPQSPKRYLSFQGRLTNQFGSPIGDSRNIVFQLYDASDALSSIWSSGSCPIDPDEDGIFSTLLGSDCGSEIDSSVFSENPEVWLGVTVAGDDEASPRIQIATVAYALNAETLQGFPISATGSATASTVLTMSAGGEVLLAEVGPKIKSEAGTFGIEGQAVTISTTGTSDGSININPDGTGTLNLNFEGASPGGSAGGFVNATDANLTSGALFYGEVASAATGYDFLQFKSGSSPSEVFAVDNAGNTDIAGDLSVSGGSLSFASGATNIDLIGSTQNALSFETNLLSLDTNQSRVGIGKTDPGYALDVVGQINASNGLCIDGSCKTDWSQITGSSYWQQANNGLAPGNLTWDLYVGNTATSGAKFHAAALETAAGNVAEVRSTGVQSGKVFSITSNALTTGSALYINNNTDNNANLIWAQAGASLSDRLTLDSDGLLKIYDSAGSHYVSLEHNGTNAALTADSGDIEIGSGAGNMTLGDASNAVNLHFGYSAAAVAIEGEAGSVINFTQAGTITPTSGSQYDLGTSSLTWDHVYSDEYCIGTDCKTSWASVGTNYWRLDGTGKVISPINATWDLTIGSDATSGAKFQVNADTGNLTSAGNLAVNGGTLSSTASTLVIDTGGNVDVQEAFNANSITSDAGVSIAAGNSYTGAGAVTLSSGGTNQALALNSSGTGAINISDGTSSTGNINIGGGSGSTGCTITNSTGDLACSGDVTILGNDIKDSGTNTRVTLGTTTTLTNTTTTLSGTTTLTASSLATLTTASALAMGSTTSLTLGGNSTINGGTGASGTLRIDSTSNGTKGNLSFNGTTTYVDGTGNIVIGGTLAVNNAAITSDDATFNMFASNVTTLNIGGAGTTTNLSGTLDPTTVNAFALAGNITANQDIDIIPAGTTGTNDLGSETYPWDHVYSDNFCIGSDCMTSWSTVGTNYWQVGTKGIAPANLTWDLYVGNTATSTANFAVEAATGNTKVAGNLAVNGGTLSSTASTLVIDTGGNVDVQEAFNANSITSDAGVSIAAGNSYTGAGAVTLSSGGTNQALALNSSGTGAINISDGTSSTGNINIGGGSGSTGCTITNSTGDLACSGDVTILGNDIKDSGTNTRVTLGTTTTLTNTTTTLSGTTTLTASSLATLTTASALAMGSTTSLTLGGNSTINGGTGASGTLRIDSTSNGTKGNLSFNGTTTYVDGTGNIVTGGTITLPNSSVLTGDTTYLRSSRGLAFGANQTYYINSSGTGNLNALTLAGTLTSNYTGTTTNAASFTANSLTSGKALNVASSATGFTGNLVDITLSGSNAANTGSLLSLTNSGVNNTGTTLYIKHYATGTNNLAFRVDDVSGDTSPFVIDGTGNVGIGTTNPTSTLYIVDSTLDSGSVYPIQFMDTNNSWSPFNIYKYNDKYSVNFGNGDFGNGTYFSVSDVSGKITFRTYTGDIQFGSSGTLDFDSSTVDLATQATNFNLKDNTANALSFETNLLSLDTTTGNNRVGIGTTTPGAPLDVNGDLYVRSGISLYNTAVSDDVVEAAKFCTGDDENNCVTNFSSLGGGAGLWQEGTKGIAPANLTWDLYVGATATSTAKFAVEANTGNTKVAGTLTLPNSSTLTGDTTYLRSSRGLAFGANETYYINSSGTGNLNALTLAGTLTLPNSSVLTGDTTYLRSSRGLAFGANQTYYINSSGTGNLNAMTLAGNLVANGNTTLGNATSDSLTIWPNTWNLTNSTPNLDLKNSTVGALNIETNLMSFDTQNSRVGIGTTTPGAKLDVNGDVDVTGTVSIFNATSSISNTSGDITIDAASGLISFSGDNIGNIQNAILSGVLQAAGSTATTYSRFGTATASHSLSTAKDLLIEGNTEIDGTLYVDSGTIANSAGTGAITFTPTPITSTNTLSASSWKVDNSINVGLAALTIDQLKAGDIFTASVSGTPKFTIKNSGNVGIGLTNPLNTLEVSGNGYFSGNLAIAGDYLGLLASNSPVFGRTLISENQVNVSTSTIGTNWTQANSTSRYYYDVAMSSDGKIQTAVLTSGEGIYQSTDYGKSWASVDANVRNYRSIAMSSDGKYQTTVIYGSTSGQGIYTSSDYGVSWGQASSTIRNYWGVAMSSDGKYQTAVSRDSGIMRSTDYGSSWTLIDSNARNYYSVAMSSDGKYQTAVISGSTSGQGIYISSNYGASWTQADNTISNRNSVAMSADGKYQTTVSTSISGNMGIFRSTDYGATWTNPDSTPRIYFEVDMTADGKYQTAVIWGGTSGQGIYISSNYGASWTQADSNARNYEGFAMSADGKYQTAVVYYLLAGQGIYISNASSTIGGGNFGIGTTTPGTMLDVAGVIRSSNYVEPTAGEGLEISYNPTTNVGRILSYDRGGSTYGDLAIGIDSGSQLYLKSTGEVGIGTNNPIATLQIQGTSGSDQLRLSNSTGNGFLYAYSTAATDATLGVYSSGGYLPLHINPQANVLLAETSGNVGIGTTSGSSLLNIGGGGSSNYQTYIKGQGTTSSTYSLVIKNSGGSTNEFYVRDDGAGYLQAGSWTYGSDIRLKENISYFNNGLDVINALKPVYFDYINGQANQIGFIAQDVQGVIPKAVEVVDPETGYLGLKEDFVIPYLVNAVKEQQGEISVLSNDLLSINLTDSGDVEITKNANDYVLTNTKTNTLISSSSAWSQSVVANLNAGIIKTGELVANGAVTISGLLKTASLEVSNNISAGAVNAKQITSDGLATLTATVDDLIIKSGLVTPKVNTQVISPLADSDININLNNSADGVNEQTYGKMNIVGENDQIVASFDAQGNATISGELDSASVKTQDLIAGKIYAEEIISRNGSFENLNVASSSAITREDIEQLLANVEADQGILSTVADTNIFTATSSASLEELALENLYVTGTSAMDSLSLTNSLSVGTDMVIQSLMDENGQLLANSIDTLSAPLSLQSLAMAPIEMMAGLFSIDTQGNVLILGNLYVAGRIDSSGLTLKPSTINNSEQDASSSASLLSLRNENGDEVAGINASGSAQFNSVTTGQIVIAGAQEASRSATMDNGVITTNATAGSATIPAGYDEIIINNPNVTNYTLVYITPTSSTQNNVLYVKSKDEGVFTVGFNQAISTKVDFNWWVISGQQPQAQANTQSQTQLP